jgi:hypothetical protein
VLSGLLMMTKNRSYEATSLRQRSLRKRQTAARKPPPGRFSWASTFEKRSAGSSDFKCAIYAFDFVSPVRRHGNGSLVPLDLEAAQILRRGRVGRASHKRGEAPHVADVVGVGTRSVSPDTLSSNDA